MLTEKDFWFLSWDAFMKGMDKVARDIEEFCAKKKIKIDYITPVMRGGGDTGYCSFA